MIDSQFLTIATGAPVKSAIEQLPVANQGTLLVVDTSRDSRYIGVFGERDVVQLLIEQKDLEQLTVGEALRYLPPLQLADIQDQVTITAYFQQQQVSAIPLIDQQGKPVGWLTCQKFLETLQTGVESTLGEEVKQTSIGVAQKQAETILRRQLNRALLLQQVTDAIRSELNPQQIFEVTATQVGRAFNVDRCLLMTYKADPQSQFLVAAEYVEPGDTTPLALRTLFFKKNAYAAQVLSQDRAVVSPNVYADRLLQPMESLCQQFGLKSMLTVRTSYQGEPNGALALHQCDRFRDWTNSEIQLLEAIAAQVGIALAQVKLLDQEKAQRVAIDQQNTRMKQEIQKRRYAEIALSRSNAALLAQQEAALDGILMVNEHRQIISFNRRFCEVWNIPVEWMTQASSPELLQRVLEQLERPKKFLNRVEQLYAHPNEISHEEVPLKNDRVLERYSAPVTSPTGEYYGRVWFFRDISERKQVERQLEQRQRYLAVLVEIQRDLLATNSTYPTYTTILKKLGQTCGADRVYLFENHLSDSHTLMTSQRAEWCTAGIEPQINNPILQNLPYTDFSPRWATMLGKGESINGTVKDFPSSEREVLEPQGIKALLVLPLMVNQIFWGFIGFDNCTEARPWTDSEVSLLSVAASAISLHQERQQAETSLMDSIRRERATLRVIEQMRQTLDLHHIFDATVHELRRLLKCDRVVIFQFQQDGGGELVAESCGAQWQPLIQPKAAGFSLPQNLCNSERCQIKTWATLYSPSTSHAATPDLPKAETRYACVGNVAIANLSQPYQDFLKQLQAKAYLIVPIYLGNNLWGLLACYQNARPRHWTASESNLVMHISSQLAIALHQAELFHQTQKQSADLEKARDAAEAANRAKSEFLTNISHELRTPLNAILGFTQVMSHDITNPKHRNYVSIINRSGQHLLKLINDVLEMSKIEAGKHRLSPTSFNFYQLLDTLYEMLSLKSQAKHLTLTFDIASDVPQYITTDEGKLHQVLLNLLGNAIKFTQAGSVTLRVTASIRPSPHPLTQLPSQLSTHRSGFGELSPRPELKTSGESGDLPKGQTADSDGIPLILHFKVEDSGLGIAPDEMADLFTPFVQTYAGTQSSEGTGLGLAISQKFIELMGGAIAVDSVPGQGSCFQFDIFAATATSSGGESRTPIQHVLSLAPHQPSYRILVVEDHRENRQLLVELLAPVGFEVRVATNGEEGLDIWEHWHPHLVLMDIRMPIMDGLTATQQIRSREALRAQTAPSTPQPDSAVPAIDEQANSALRSTTKIIAITSNAFEKDRIAILSMGCDDFISKPFREEMIFTKLAEHLGVKFTHGTCSSSIYKKENLSTNENELILHSLKKMPKDWVHQMNEAAVQGRDSSMSELINSIPDDYVDLIKELEKLITGFQFQEIIDLLSS